ncbi:MAG: anthranilate phosphoribosyltransferase, partial [Actinobacteria bacterium]|nr:anthranilate phosphoribosyltransferase [Actinomycetota bacterium]
MNDALSWKSIFGNLVAAEDLTRDQADWAMRQIISAEATP